MELSESFNEHDNEDGGVNDEEEGSQPEQSHTNNNSKCFSIIQSKKFWAPPLLSACRLCPSMDLVILGMQTPADASSTTSLWLHRTVSWQRLSTLTEFEDDTDTTSSTTTASTAAAAVSTSATSSDTDQQKNGVNHVAWSPDGRKFALARPNGTVLLYHVEAMVSSGSSSMSGETASQQGLLCVIPVSPPGSVLLGLTWVHGGRHHPQWNLTSAEEEAEISWGYVRVSLFLFVFLWYSGFVKLEFHSFDVFYTGREMASPTHLNF